MREGEEKNTNFNETMEERKKERSLQGRRGSELQRISLSRAALFNVSISVAPLWLKIRVHINRHWSDFYCLKDKMATIYVSYLFHISNIIYLNQNDMTDDEISGFHTVFSFKLRHHSPSPGM